MNYEQDEIRHRPQNVNLWDENGLYIDRKGHLQRVPGMRCEVKTNQESIDVCKETERMKSFKKHGLIGCLNGTGVTSENYKSSLEMMADLGLLGAIEDSEVTSESYKGYLRKNRIRRKIT